MSNRVGSSTIYSTILPNNQALSRIHSVKLSREARHRLKVIEYYHKTGNVSLTCRHFGIGRSYFYKWCKRFNPKDLASLEDHSRRPRSVRPATYDYELVKLIRKLRQDYTRLSAKKLAVVLLRDYDISYSAATIGRIIQKFQLYFARIVRVSKARKAAVKAWIKRKPYNLKANGPHQVIEFDMKHINSLGQRTYAFVAVDPFTKEALIHVAGSPSSHQAKVALEQVLSRFGTNICVVNDNGSENFKHAYEYLRDQDVTQYFARPHTPKDKPHVENLIGKLQQECLDENISARSVSELQCLVNKWLNDYHFFRPHQALDYLTPDEFCATLNITIPRARLSTM
jgi:transposase InsO family protein